MMATTPNRPDRPDAGADRSRSRLAGLLTVVALVVAAVITLVAGLGLVMVLDRDDGEATAGQDDRATPPIGAETTTTPERISPAAPAGADPSTTTVTTVTATVEADDEAADDGELTVDAAGDADPDPVETVPTLPPPTTGSCQLTMSALSGRSGRVDLGADGACGLVGATITAVNPRDDLSTIDWGADIRVCERHPAAVDVRIDATVGGSASAVDPALNRTPDQGATEPITALVLTFDQQATPRTGPRPLLVCRTSTAELSIVHRPAGT